MLKALTPFVTSTPPTPFSRAYTSPAHVVNSVAVPFTRASHRSTHSIHLSSRSHLMCGFANRGAAHGLTGERKWRKPSLTTSSHDMPWVYQRLVAGSRVAPRKTIGTMELNAGRQGCDRDSKRVRGTENASAETFGSRPGALLSSRPRARAWDDGFLAGRDSGDFGFASRFRCAVTASGSQSASNLEVLPDREEEAPTTARGRQPRGQ